MKKTYAATAGDEVASFETMESAVTWALAKAEQKNLVSVELQEIRTFSWLVSRPITLPET